MTSAMATLCVLAVAAACGAVLGDTDEGSCTNPTADLVGAATVIAHAESLVDSWLTASPIPGEYTTPDERLKTPTHPGDHSHLEIFTRGKGGIDDREAARAGWHHTRPNDIYTRKRGGKAARKQMVEAVAFHLWRGISRLRDDVRVLLRSDPAPRRRPGFPESESPRSVTAHVDEVLELARRALNSYEDVWRQITWTVAYGPRQVEWHVDEEQREYGPETAFFLKFRPTLSCYRTMRIGPELGGAKMFCNPDQYTDDDHPVNILSGGSGDDFLYEHIVADVWRGVTVVTLDCFQFDEPAKRKLGDGGKVLIMPLCLGGESEHTNYADFAPPHLRSRFVSVGKLIENLKANHGVDHFDLVKINIEASEYPTLADALQDPDQTMRGVSQLHMEMHRMGMHNGRDFNSLLFMNLLLAQIMGAGYHTVGIEKWHDAQAASDFAFVNQSWWMRAEMRARGAVWEAGRPHVGTPETFTAPLAVPRHDPELLHAAHAAGKDPFAFPRGAEPKRSKPRKKKDADEDGAEPPKAPQVATLDAKGLETLMSSPYPVSLVMFHTVQCFDCTAIAPFWDMFANGARWQIPFHVVECQKTRPGCNEAGVLDSEVGPIMAVWTGGKFERYDGKKDPHALGEWVMDWAKRVNTESSEDEKMSMW